MNILVVAAHPDDEVLGCGGTIARLAQENHSVSIAILSKRHFGMEIIHVRELLHGWREYTNDLPDQRFDTIDFLDIVQWIEAVINEARPVVIYTHHTADLNLDHALTARAVLTATRPKPGCGVKDVYMFEVPSCTEWGFNYQFKPNVFVDIEATFEKKLDAMMTYESEVRDYPHPRSLDMMKANAQRWGATAGIELAEAFELVRSIR